MTERTRFSRRTMAILIALVVCANASYAQEDNRTRDLAPGTFSWSLAHGGLTRTYRIHIPASYNPATPPPLVFVLHGGTGTGRGAEVLSYFSPVSDREGFIVVYPDGIGRTWNDGRGLERFQAMKDNVDDVGFFAALIDELHTRLNIDRTRVYAAGISNGGHMVHRLGIELSNKITAIGPVAATVAKTIVQNAPKGFPVGVIDFHGTEDRHNFWDGGGRAGGDTFAVPDIIAWWVKRNECVAEPETIELPDGENDGTRITRSVYASGTGGVEVALYKIEGGGHTWPGGYQYLAESEIGRTTRDIHGSELMWEFFKRHSRPEAAK